MGGAMCNNGSAGKCSPTLTNVAFAGNPVGNKGGAMQNNGRTAASCPTLTNITFSGNSAAQGGAVYNDGYLGVCAPHMRNSILWNNMDSSGTGNISATIFNNTSAVTLTNSLVEGTGGSGSSSWLDTFFDGGENIDMHPMFIIAVEPPTIPAEEGNLRLNSRSSAIDRVNNHYVKGVPTDLDGVARIKDGDGNGTGTLDMSAYETETHHFMTVLKAGTGSGKVINSPEGIDRGEICSVLFEQDTNILLEENPDTGSEVYRGLGCR